MRNRLSTLYLYFCYCYFILAALIITSTYASHHFISDSYNFVIINSNEPQRYKLFAVFPHLRTVKEQVLIGFTFTIVVGLPLFLYFFLRPRHPYADWTSQLPDSIVNLLYYLRLEYSAYKGVILKEIMTVLNAPLRLGLDIAANVSMWSPLGTKDRHGKNAGSETYPKTGRSALRRKFYHGSGLSNGSSTVQAASDQAVYYAGLYNTGNSCFLNSTLQSLASLAVLRGYLENLMEMAETWDVPTPVTDALHDLVVELNSPVIKRSALVPRQLTDALSSLPQTNVGSFFYAHQQQDAHELLVLLTSAIDDELNIVLSEKAYAQRRQAVGLRAAVAPSIPSLYTSSSFATTSTNPFRSLIAQRTACLDCGYAEAVRHYPADELSLGVPVRSGSAVTLEMCLKSWSRLERVDWICFRCSLRKTLEKVRESAKKNMNGSINGHTIEAINNEARPKSQGPEGNGSTSTSNGKGNKVGNSKKKKLREIRRKESVLLQILEGGLSEDEVESSHLLERADLKLERAFSSLSTKQVMIARTPKVLTIHLNRSSYSASNFGASKNNATVLFDEILDISEVVTSGELNISGDVPISRGSTPIRDQRAGVVAAQQDRQGYLIQDQESMRMLYRLCAIVVHYGSHSAGHYVSFRRRNIKVKGAHSSLLVDDVDQESKGRQVYRDAWFRISDDSVSTCSLRDVLAQNPFILFYEQLNEDDSGANGLQDDYSATKKNNGTLLPTGFETFGRNEMQKRRSAFQPRVVERWNAVH